MSDSGRGVVFPFFFCHQSLLPPTDNAVQYCAYTRRDARNAPEAVADEEGAEGRDGHQPHPPQARDGVLHFCSSVSVCGGMVGVEMIDVSCMLSVQGVVYIFLDTPHTINSSHIHLHNP